MLNEPEDSSKGSLIWKIAAGVLLLLTLLFVALMIVGFVNSGSAQSDLENERSENKRLTDENESLKKSLADAQASVVEWKTKAEIFERNYTDLKNITSNMTVILEAQKVQIATLQKTNQYLWIGGGASLALGLGGSGYSVYARYRINYLESEVVSLQKNADEYKKRLDEMTMKYNHYYNYFQNSNRKLMDYSLGHYRQGNYNWELLYDGRYSWNKESLKSAIRDKDMTTTVITTDKGWVIAGFLKKAWVVDGTYVSDQDAWTMSVDRAIEAPISRTSQDRYGKAARIGGTGVLLEFGDQEIVINEDKTGKAKAGVTYNPTETYYSDEFYAGAPAFNITSIMVYRTGQWNPVNTEGQ